MNDEDRVRELLLSVPVAGRPRGFEDVRARAKRGQRNIWPLLLAFGAIVVGLSIGRAVVDVREWRSGQAGPLPIPNLATPSPSPTLPVGCGLAPRPLYVPSGFVEVGASRSADRSTIRYQDGLSELHIVIARAPQSPTVGTAQVIGDRSVTISRAESSGRTTATATWTDRNMWCPFLTVLMSVPGHSPLDPQAEVIRVIGSMPTIRATTQPHTTASPSGARVP